MKKLKFLFIFLITFNTATADNYPFSIIKKDQCGKIIKELNQCYQKTKNKYICLENISPKYCLPQRKKIGMCKTDFAVSLSTI